MPSIAAYGELPGPLLQLPEGAQQLSPLLPGSGALEATGPLDSFYLLAPPGTLERAYALSFLLEALHPGAPFLALAPKQKGGSRLRKELLAFGCSVEEEGRSHFRICRGIRPEVLQGIAEAREAGAPRLLEGWHTQPGVFSWDRVDEGSRLLLEALPELRGRGADLGAGTGVLSRAVLGGSGVTGLLLLELDRRAITCAQKNIRDPRAQFRWEDLRSCSPGGDLDFVVMNPPFHDGGREDTALGLLFLDRAAQFLRPGGSCFLVANRHLPYEDRIEALFRAKKLLRQERGFKVYEAIR